MEPVPSNPGRAALGDLDLGGGPVLTQERWLSPDRVAKIYRRHWQGAWVRSGASLFIWIFVLAAYFMGIIEYYSFAGILGSVIFLILINPPTLWVIKRLRSRKSLEFFSFFINVLEVIGYTAVIYFAGVFNRAYLTLIYPALITYIGVVAPWRWSFMLAGCCSLAFTGMVVLENVGVIPQTRQALSIDWTFARQLHDSAILTALLLVTAFIVSYTSKLIRSGKEKLREQYTALKRSQDKITQGRQVLEEKNQALEAAMERAQASDRKKSEFLANMSHELRTPLNHIIGFTELVADRNVGPLNATQEEYLKDVLGSSRHLLSLINDILDLSKVEAGKMDREVSEFPLEGLFRNSLTMVKEKALKHRIALTPHFQEIPAAIRADERKLKKILYNLLSNAVKFTPDGGRVELAARGMDGQGVEVTVSDTGIGLAEDDLERIFQSFEQGDNSAGRRYQGTGLGLSLTKRLVELHGGRIWARQRAEGAGAVFSFTIPVMPAGEAVFQKEQRTV